MSNKLGQWMSRVKGPEKPAAPAVKPQPPVTSPASTAAAPLTSPEAAAASMATAVFGWKAKLMKKLEKKEETTEKATIDPSMRPRTCPRAPSLWFSFGYSRLVPCVLRFTEYSEPL